MSEGEADPRYAKRKSTVVTAERPASLDEMAKTAASYFPGRQTEDYWMGSRIGTRGRLKGGGRTIRGLTEAVMDNGKNDSRGRTVEGVGVGNLN